MAMLGQQLTGHLPFSQVLLHSLVRDSQGRKMSKSLGNVIDPRDIIRGATLQELQEKLRSRVLDPQELQAAEEGQRRQFPQGIPECGADALRLALSTHNAHGPEIRLGVASVLTQRRFCNKVWNGVGFVLRALGGDRGTPKTPPEQVLPGSPLDRWVLARLAAAVAECGRRLEALEPQGAAARRAELLAAQLLRRLPGGVQGVPAVPGAPSRRPGDAAGLRRAGAAPAGPLRPLRGRGALAAPAPRPPPRPPRSAGPRSPTPGNWRTGAAPSWRRRWRPCWSWCGPCGGLRETFRLGGAARPPVLVQCPEPARDWLEPLGPAFRTLSGAGPVRLLPPGAGPGPGWAGAPAGPGTFVHLQIQGLVEPGAARAQLCARLRSLERRLRSLGGASPNPPGGAEQHQAAVLRAELARLEQALQALETPGDPLRDPPGDPLSPRGDPQLQGGPEI
ncbi:valine--tRNA ligase, mitochondrial isoform X2 [Corvus hawaiiensis]|uniref:valine--tRNA ligase, mitochondrial isoform X2 n=1 Tax=Corvus hawaiiensis TaxID=134902 RepID=UPI00201850EA|nr:valine--tRNA ligase, mitochondrial isoform X2 [Corvus hawaiiensis]